MIKVKLLGTALLILSLSLVALMSYTFIAPFEVSETIIKLTLWVYTIIISSLVGWIGFVLLTTKQPKSAEEVKREIEAEIEEIKKEAIDAVLHANNVPKGEDEVS